MLNVEHDAEALAMLIASSKVAPPLSIGLFGEWGSGKSFFIACCRVGGPEGPGSPAKR